MIQALRRVIQRMPDPLEVMLMCVGALARWPGGPTTRAALIGWRCASSTRAALEQDGPQ